MKKNVLKVALIAVSVCAVSGITNVFAGLIVEAPVLSTGNSLSDYASTNTDDWSPSKNNFAISVDSDEYQKLQKENEEYIKRTQVKDTLKETLSANDYNNVMIKDDAIVIYYTNKANVEKVVKTIDTDVEIKYEKVDYSKSQLEKRINILKRMSIIKNNMDIIDDITYTTDGIVINAQKDIPELEAWIKKTKNTSMISLNSAAKVKNNPAIGIAE